MIFQGGHHSRDAVSELDRHGGDQPINCVVAKSSESEAIQSAYVFGSLPVKSVIGQSINLSVSQFLHLYNGANHNTSDYCIK